MNVDVLYDLMVQPITKLDPWNVKIENWTGSHLLVLLPRPLLSLSLSLSPLSEVILSTPSPSPNPLTSISGRHRGSLICSLCRVRSVISVRVSLFDLVRGPGHSPDYFRDQVTTAFPPLHSGKISPNYRHKQATLTWKLCKIKSFTIQMYSSSHCNM